MSEHWTDGFNTAVFVAFDRYIGVFVVGILICFFLFIGFAVYQSHRPSFRLNKDDWVCTQADQEIVMVGKILVPQNVCIQYTRK